MNSRISIMLVIALLFAGGAAWVAYRWVTIQPGQKAADPNVVPIVVAAAEIPFGSKIDKVHVKMSKFPKDGVPDGSFSDTKLVIDKIAQRKFIANEVLLAPQVKEHLGGSTLSALITQGMRAVSVRVNDVVGVAGFIAPGNKVDIIATRKKGSTYPLLSNVKVLAIGQRASPDQEKPALVKSLTLELTPKDAQKVVDAGRKASLYFTLRNPLDDTKIATSEFIDTPTQEIEIIETLDVVEESTAPPPVHKKVKRVTKPKAPSFKMIPWKKRTQDEFGEG